MKVKRLKPNQAGIVEWPVLSTTRKTVLTVGEFDGMHRGHQAILKRVVDLARSSDCLAVAIMFEPSPKRVHLYARSHAMRDLPDDLAETDPDEIMGMDERLRLMGKMGLDQVLLVKYTLSFAAKSYRFFLSQLVERLGMQTLVLGQDARMGSGRAGDVTAIGKYAGEMDSFALDVVEDRGPGYTAVPRRVLDEDAEDGGEGLSHSSTEVRIWSTTNLRHLLAQGQIREANEILGRPHEVEGLVVHGEGRGRELGYPTANLSCKHTGFMPGEGVYAGWLVDLGPQTSREGFEEGDGQPSRVTPPVSNPQVRLENGSPWRLPAAISIGTKETFLNKNSSAQRVLEANVISKDWLDLYGHRVRIEFLDFLRPQERYAGAEELKKQLAKDAQRSIAITQARPA